MKTFKPMTQEEIERIDKDDERGYFDWDAYLNRMTFYGKLKFVFGIR